jgi:hypothetical protein
MEKKRETGCGISKSDFAKTAIKPRKKKSTGALKRLLIKTSIFMKFIAKVRLCYEK